MPQFYFNFFYWIKFFNTRRCLKVFFIIKLKICIILVKLFFHNLTQFFNNRIRFWLIIIYNFDFMRRIMLNTYCFYLYLLFNTFLLDFNYFLSFNFCLDFRASLNLFNHNFRIFGKILNFSHKVFNIFTITLLGGLIIILMLG